MKLTWSIDRWTLKKPFVTAQDHLHHIEVLTVELREGTLTGRGEALGVDYLGETAQTMAEQVKVISPLIEKGLSVTRLADLLPPGGARNALDCALWDLASKRQQKRCWDLLEIEVKPVTSLYTLSLDTADAMAGQAAEHGSCPLLKLKLDAHDPAQKIKAIRAARPDATLVIDANEGWSPELLHEIKDTVVGCEISMIEQPLPRSEDHNLERGAYPVPLCADESCQVLSDLPRIARHYDMVNIKLDKCGGLTSALEMVHWCQKQGLELMVGNMLGSSLAMAPAFIVAQFCRFADLDGPLWQREDYHPPIKYHHSTLEAPRAELWG